MTRLPPPWASVRECPLSEVCYTKVGMEPRAVWVGLADVKPKEGNDALEGGAGAFVHVLAPAESRDDFAQVVRRLFAEESFEIIGLEGVEPFEDRLRHGYVVPRIARLAQHVLASQRPAYDEQWNSYEEP